MRHPLAVALLLSALPWVHADDPPSVAYAIPHSVGSRDVPLPDIWAHQAAALERAWGRPVRPVVLRPDGIPPGCRVLVLLPSLAAHYAELDALATRFHAFVADGGGLVLFQPNPLATHPVDLPVSPTLRGLDHVEERCRPAFLPLAATFFNRYVESDTRRIVRAEHPIVRGLADTDMPYACDRIVDLDPAYVPLVVGTSSESVSLAVAVHGRGRIVLCGDNVTGGSRSRLPTALVRRMVAWAAGESDVAVAAIAPTGDFTAVEAPLAPERMEPRRTVEPPAERGR